VGRPVKVIQFARFFNITGRSQETAEMSPRSYTHELLPKTKKCGTVKVFKLEHEKDANHTSGRHFVAALTALATAISYPTE
jgi:hypothetical protein